MRRCGFLAFVLMLTAACGSSPSSRSSSGVVTPAGNKSVTNSVFTATF